MVFEFKSVFDLLQAFPTEQACIEHLEKLHWNGKPVSPFDKTSTVYKCAGNKYKCKNTGKYFNVKVGTIFEDTKIPLQKWFLALYTFSSHKKGISSHQLAKDIQVTQKSAWFMLHRLRYAFDHPNFKKVLENTVEVDETHIGGKAKNKHSNKKNRNAEGATLREQQPVIGMLERGSHVIAKVVENKNKETLLAVIDTHVTPNAEVMTDELVAYKDLSKKYNHNVVKHSAKEYVNGKAFTNTIENFWSHLKRGIEGIYHWVSKIHLQRYVDEFALRYNTRKFSTQGRFDLVLASIPGKRLTYKSLIK